MVARGQKRRRTATSAGGRRKSGRAVSVRQKKNPSPQRSSTSTVLVGPQGRSSLLFWFASFLFLLFLFFSKLQHGERHGYALHLIGVMCKQVLRTEVYYIFPGRKGRPLRINEEPCGAQSTCTEDGAAAISPEETTNRRGRLLIFGSSFYLALPVLLPPPSMVFSRTAACVRTVSGKRN